MKYLRRVLGLTGAALIVLAAHTTQAIDIYAYILAKGSAISQTGTSSSSVQGYALNAFVNGTGPGTLTSAFFKKGTTQFNLVDNGGDGSNLEYKSTYASLSAMDAAFPNTGSTYSFTITGANDGLKGPFTVSFAAVNSYPNDPLISNYTAAQSINPTQNFTFTWGVEWTEFVRFYSTIH